jgi:phosphate uptake regulator
MLKSLANFFRGEDWTTEVVVKFDEMLGLAEQNFALCAEHVLDDSDFEKIRDELYARDREINTRERIIRRRIISHLATQPTEHEIPTAFILTNIVKDAERIGDYVKNLYEVHQIHPESAYDRVVYDRYYDGIRTQVRKLFAAVRQAFRTSDAKLAHSAITSGRETQRHCEKAIRDIARGEHTVPDAVALVLTGRHYKRIAAHLVNIATSVVMPADRLDYYDEPPDKP